MDEILTLDNLLKMSEEEHDILEWCLVTLDKHQIAAAQSKAREIVTAELRADDAAALMTATLVKIILRGVRAARLELARKREGLKRKRRKS